jgi:hypothetical protein
VIKKLKKANLLLLAIFCFIGFASSIWAQDIPADPAKTYESTPITNSETLIDSLTKKSDSQLVENALLENLTSSSQIVGGSALINQTSANQTAGYLNEGNITLTNIFIQDVR